ncbi:MAG: PAS domain S-box protein [Desulfuromonadaceae bacterium]
MEKGDPIYRILLESASEGVVIMDGEGRILMFNAKAEELFGYQKEEIFEQNVDLVLPEFDRDIYGEPMAENVTAAGNSQRGSVEFGRVAKRKDGSEFPVEIALSQAGAWENRVMMAVVNDISRRQEWEEEKAQFYQDRVRALEDTVATLKAIIRSHDEGREFPFPEAPSLRKASGSLFENLVEEYGLIMDEVLEQKIYKSGASAAEHLRDFSVRLGFLKATPRDVVELHSAALVKKCHAQTVTPMRGYVEEGHFLLVEMIGHLATYYRNRVLSREIMGSPVER